MSTISAAAGASMLASTPLTGIAPQPAVSARPGASLAASLPPMTMPSFPPQGEIVEPSSDKDTRPAAADSDPQQLLDLLLAAPVAQTVEDGAVLSVRFAAAASPSEGGDSSTLNLQAESAGLLRNNLLAAGTPLSGLAQPEAKAMVLAPLPAAGRGHSTVMPSFATPSSPAKTAGSEADVAEFALYNIPKKLVTSADALLASKSVQQMLRVDREPSVAESTLLPAAPPLVNALLKGEVNGIKLPAIALPSAPEQQAEALQKALAERLEMQIDRRVQKATIRLDPPNLGKMDISIHFESGKLQVQIQAAQPEVTRLLQQVSHEMRASLSEQNNVQVNVQVSTQSGDSRQQQRHRDRPETAIANNNEEVTPQQRGTDGTILTMV
ncbi:flagellar hook-length control protein FliK [Pantoea coffeiphila]|uniref:Flagellar hook-length control protein-like C-terminal domain-containing protein n=1 Tax=Pantoea coffeiphila TaxID=1465635 RepID=A0A2S9IHU6_9GAMM|nr:flagellar hook-length control protein FliK [Pantoea coffeiphila]PRD17358.1 hypothetical protein CQW29_01610 [Pantoea coffeiphila]